MRFYCLQFILRIDTFYIIYINLKDILFHNKKEGNRLYKFLKSKVLESLSSVIPIVVIVLILSFTIVPMPWYIILLFLIGAILLIFGMGLFTLGADIAMIPMGERVGAQLTKSRNLTLLVLISLLFGMMITIAEPDLQVLATQVPSIPNMTLILCVSLGVGCFLVLALLRILFQISLVKLLVIFYIIVFILAYISPTRFLAVASAGRDVHRVVGESGEGAFQPRGVDVAHGFHEGVKLSVARRRVLILLAVHHELDGGRGPEAACEVESIVDHAHPRRDGGVLEHVGHDERQIALGHYLLHKEA